MLKQIYNEYFKYLLTAIRPTDACLERISVNLNHDITMDQQKAFFQNFKKNCGDELIIKLVIVGLDSKETVTSTLKTKIASLLAGIANATDYGVVHTAVQVGPYLVDWNKSCLCYP
jgi:hypothetical protein